MDEKERLDSLEREKGRMIQYYLTLQDKVDAVNEEIYRTCCGIETLNVQITQAQEAIRKAGLKEPPRGGNAPARVEKNGRAT
jgi:hypothetical protein